MDTGELIRSLAARFRFSSAVKREAHHRGRAQSRVQWAGGDMSELPQATAILPMCVGLVGSVTLEQRDVRVAFLDFRGTMIFGGLRAEVGFGPRSYVRRAGGVGAGPSRAGSAVSTTVSLLQFEELYEVHLGRAFPRLEGDSAHGFRSPKPTESRSPPTFMSAARRAAPPIQFSGSRRRSAWRPPSSTRPVRTRLPRGWRSSAKWSSSAASRRRFAS